MKITLNQEKVFKPVKIQIALETEEELNVLREIFSTTSTNSFLRTHTKDYTSDDKFVKVAEEFTNKFYKQLYNL